MRVFAPEPGKLEAWADRVESNRRVGAPLADDGAFRFEELRRAAQAGIPLLAAGDDDAGIVTGWQHAEWDTEMLGIRVARMLAPVAWGRHDSLDVAARAVGSAIMDEAAAAEVTLVVTRVAAEDAGASHGFASAGLSVVDLNVQYRRDTTDLPTRSPFSTPAEPKDAAALRALASVFVHDHFHADERVPRDRADALYAQWIDNSTAGRADAVLVARTDDGDVEGFITCVAGEGLGGRSSGRIELVATAPSARGRGVGSRLVWDALAWFRSSGIEVVDVGMQFANVGARRLYQTCGFGLLSAATTHHGWPGEPPGAG